MKFLYSIILIACYAIVSAQNTVADSLLVILKNNSNTRAAPDLRNQISEAYQSSDPVQMQKHAQFALAVSIKNQNKFQQARAYQNIGVSHIILGNYQQAIHHFDLSERVLLSLRDESKNTKELLAKTLGSKGLAFSEINNYAEALDCDLKAMRIYEVLGNKLQLSKICNNIGVIYNSIDDEDKALQYFLKANQLQKKQNNPAVAVSASNIGLIYLNQNRKDQAKKYFDESLISFEENPDPRGLGELYNNLGRYYIAEQQYDKAQSHLLKAEKTFEGIQDQFGLSDTYFLLAELFFEENKLDQSLEFANKCLALSKELDLPETKMKCEKFLSTFYDSQGNQKLALFHLKNYDLEKDRVQKLKNEQKRLNTELHFQYEKSQMEKKDSAERDRLKLVLGFVILIFVLAAIFFYDRNRQRQQKILLHKQLAEFEHKALHLQMNPHFVFNCLAAISSFIMQNGKEDAMKYLSKFSKLMRLTLEFSKESAIPIYKEIEALQNYLELEQLRFNQKFDFIISKSPDIEDDTAIPTLLLQPYVENAILHGVAPKVGTGFIKIHFSQDTKQLICVIEDDGVGIESSLKMKEDAVKVHKSMALEISRKRLETLEKIENRKVDLDIEELKDRNQNTVGTRITLKLPLNFIKN